MSKRDHNLNDQQKRFCDEYLIDLNGEQAAIRAQYSKKTARGQASRLLTNANVKDYIEKGRRRQQRKAEVTQDRVIARLSSLAFIDPADLYHTDGSLMLISEMDEEVRAALGAIDVKEYKDKRGGKTTHTKVKLTDSLAALNMLARILGMYEKDNAQQHVEIKPMVMFLPLNGREADEPSSDHDTEAV